MPRVWLLTGTARSDRAERIDALFLQHPGESLLIVPTRRHAEHRAAQLLHKSGRPGWLGRPVVTFQDFATQVLEGSPSAHPQITPLRQRILLEQAIDRVREAGALDDLGDAANTEGFLDHLLHVIAQLKQAAVDPDQFARTIEDRRDTSPLDAAVVAVYRAYQDELQQAQAVDLQGMYWLARVECETHKPALFESVRNVLLDGFDDFTTSEFNLIVAASTHLDGLAFGLNHDTRPQQEQLYAVPKKTYDNVRAQFSERLEIPETEEKPPETASDFVAQSLLLRETPRAPKDLVQNVRLIESHTLDHEIETVARAIKALVREHVVRLRDIAVVHRRSRPLAGVVRDIFSEYGIPIRGLDEAPLADSALASFVLHALETAASWANDAVLDIVTSPWFAGPDTPHTDAFPMLVRAARLRPTRQSWQRGIAQLQRLMDDPRSQEIEDLLKHMPRAKEAARALAEAVERFNAQSAPLTRQHSVSGWVDAVDTLLDAWPIAHTLARLFEADRTEGSEAASRNGAFELAAWNAMRATLGRLRDWQDGDDRALSPAEFTRLLHRAFDLQTANTDAPAGGVQWLDMASARYLTFDYVFLVGMTQGEMPVPPRANAIYDDADRDELSALDIHLDGPEAHSQREILLFQRMFSIAHKRLTVSWHALTQSGQTIGPSLFLEEVKTLLDVEPDRPRDPAHVLTPRPGAVGCTRDLRNLVFASRAAGNARRKHFPREDAAAAIERRRYAAGPCDDHDGVLASPANLEALDNKYGPDFLYSASQLETYAACPFLFFQERVLELFTIEPPEQAFDRMARGNVLHESLETFHRHFEGRAITDIPADEAEETMRACAAEAFDKIAWRYTNLGEGLLNAERGRILKTLQQYLVIERARNGNEVWKPFQFEVRFGADRAKNGDGALAPYRLALEEGHVDLRGQIDRVDRNGDVLRIVDYKSSTTSGKDIEDGKVFQLALYALAAEERLFPESTCEEAIYLAVGKKSSGRTVALSRSKAKYDWERRAQIARDAIARAVRGIRAGHFAPAHDKTPCQRCPIENTCRYERARMLRKVAE